MSDGGSHQHPLGAWLPHLPWHESSAGGVGVGMGVGVGVGTGTGLDVGLGQTLSGCGSHL